MNIVIDIQGLIDNYNNFIPKEVAVVSIEHQYSSHWLVKPPYKCSVLAPEIIKKNQWLRRNHHGIDWSEGETSLQTIEIILKQLAFRASRIFTRGSVKSAYLSDLTGGFIINLEGDDDCPSFDSLPQSAVHCIHHGSSSEHGSYKCALNKAMRIKGWLAERIDSIWEYRKITTLRVDLSEYDEEEEEKNEDVEKHPESLEIECDEQSTNSAISPEHTATFGGCIPGRSYSQGVDETDSIRS